MRSSGSLLSRSKLKKFVVIVVRYESLFELNEGSSTSADNLSSAPCLAPTEIRAESLESAATGPIWLDSGYNALESQGPTGNRESATSRSPEL